MKMKINRLVVLLLVLSFVFGINIVFAKTISDNFATVLSSYADEAERYYQRVCTRSRLRGIRAFVCHLSHRIDEIPQGPPEPSGPSLKMIDSNGEDIGLVIDTGGDGGYTGQAGVYFEIWDYNLQKFVRVNLVGWLGYRSVQDRNFYYASGDCTGPPVMHAVSPYHYYSLGTPNRYGWGFIQVSDVSKIKIDFAYNSYWSNSSQNCETLTSGLGAISAEISEFTDHPNYNEPLQIVEQ